MCRSEHQILLLADLNLVFLFHAESFAQETEFVDAQDQLTAIQVQETAQVRASRETELKFHVINTLMPIYSN